MTWLRRYQFRNYINRSLWILPAIGIASALVAVKIINDIDLELGLQSEVDPATAVTLLGTLAGSMFTFIVFVCSALLISVQLASAQLTPRIIGLVLQSRGIQVSLTLFVFTFTLVLAALVRIKGTVPLLTAYVSSYIGLISIIAFLMLVGRVCYTLRPSGALALVGKHGRDVVKRVYPRRLTEAEHVVSTNGNHYLSKELNCTVPNLSEGVLLAFDPKGLASIARSADCVLELLPQVGDFVTVGQPLFRVYGQSNPPLARQLYHSVALGLERTVEQDPAFALRIMVDIASKGLSPAINDPTTAVLAIDQIHYLLQLIGDRFLDEGIMRDSQGTVRLLYRTPGWDDFIQLAVTEIRHYGGGSIQVVRRLRAMLENLIESVPQERAKILHMELSLVDRAAKKFFSEVEDRNTADVSDPQGMGGKQALAV